MMTTKNSASMQAQQRLFDLIDSAAGTATTNVPTYHICQNLVVDVPQIVL